MVDSALNLSILLVEIAKYAASVHGSSSSRYLLILERKLDFFFSDKEAHRLVLTRVLNIGLVFVLTSSLQIP
jgi:hypothetical protein